LLLITLGNATKTGMILFAFRQPWWPRRVSTAVTGIFANIANELGVAVFTVNMHRKHWVYFKPVSIGEDYDDYTSSIAM
jgi:hypothetical protein